MRVKTTDWDRLASSAPLNADAARAWVYSYEDDAAPPVRLDHVVFPIPSGMYRNPSFRNLVGIHNGRLTVVGYAGSNNGARWVVQCRCGRYEIRSTKTIIKATAACCGPCWRKMGDR